MAKKGIIYVILGILIVMGFWALVGMYFSELDPIPLDNENTYINEVFGYKYLYDSDLEVDLSMEEIKTVIENEDIKIQIFYDNFKNSINNTDNLINYGNESIKSNDYIEVLMEDTNYKYGIKTLTTQWKRKEINSIDEDLNYYTLFQYIIDKDEAYSVLIKSKKELEYSDYIWKIGFIEKKENISNLNMEKLNPKKTLNPDTRAGKLYEDIFEKDQKLSWGIFYPEANKGNYSKFYDLEEKLNYKFKVLLEYKGLNTEAYSKLFEIEDRIVEYTFQVLGNNDNPTVMYEILEGKHDMLIKEVASEIKKYNGGVLFRLNNEMNGDWCSYSAWFTQTDTDIYIEVWKYFYEIFEEEKVDNVLWVWNPNWGDFPEFKWNHYMNYFPGEKYVDIVGLTGYNTGNYYDYEYWREFKEIYDPMLEEYNDYFGYEFIITEFGSNSVGGDKALWIEKMMNEIQKYDIKLAIWFSSIDYDSNGDPARIYLLDENEKILNAFKEGLEKYYD
jgi:hypothetical protein